MTIESDTGTEFLHIVISSGLLLFAAKIFAELFARLKLPIVLGELVAGIIVGPFALGGLPCNLRNYICSNCGSEQTTKD